MVPGLTDPVEKSVTYDGNGGTYEGQTSLKFTNDTAVLNMFSYSDHTFICWNTEKDGSGTDYKVGDPVSDGMTLYAKWGDAPLKVSSYNTSTSGTFSETLKFTINGQTLGILSTFYSSGIIVADFGTGWNYDLDGFVFTGFIGETKVTLKIEITGCTEGSVVCEVYDDLPTVGFKSTGDIGVFITVVKVVR